MYGWIYNIKRLYISVCAVFNENFANKQSTFLYNNNNNNDPINFSCKIC